MNNIQLPGNSSNQTCSHVLCWEAVVWQGENWVLLVVQHLRELKALDWMIITPLLSVLWQLDYYYLKSHPVLNKLIILPQIILLKTNLKKEYFRELLLL